MQDKISEQLVIGKIPEGMDFNGFVEMIEQAGVLEDDE
jgi:hypothetical protein